MKNLVYRQIGWGVLVILVIGTHLTFAQKTLYANFDAIHHVKFSPDGKKLFTGCTDGIAKLWDLSSGQAVATYKGHSGDVIAAAFSPDGSVLASAGNDGGIRTWNVQTGHQIREFAKDPSGGFFPKNLTYSELEFKDDTQLLGMGNYVLSTLYQINTFDVNSGSKLQTIRSDEFYVSMGLLPAKRRVVASAANFQQKSWLAIVDLETRDKQVLATGLDDLNVAVSSDGKYAACGGMRSHLLLFDLESGQKVYQKHSGFSKIKNVAFSEDGRFIVTGSQFDLAIWDKNSGQILDTKKLTADINSIDVNGHRVAVGLGDGQVKIYDDLFEYETSKTVVATKATIGQFAFDALGQEPMIVFERGIHQARVPAVAYSIDGTEIVTASWDKTIRIWNASDGRLKRVIRVPAWKGSEGQIFTMEVSPDKKFIIAAGFSLGIRDQTQSEDYIGDYVLLLDYQTGEVLDAIGAHKQTIQRIAFSQDGNYVVSGAGDLDSRVIVFKLDRLNKKLVKHAERNMADLSGSFYPSCSDRNFMGGLCSNQVLSVGFVPGTNEVLSIDVLGMLVKQPLNLSSFRLLGESLNRKTAGSLGKISDNAMFRLLEVDPKGRYVAAGDYSGLVTLYDLKNTTPKSLTKGQSYEKALINIPSFGDLLMAIAISSDGDKIALATDNKINVYDISLDGTPMNLNTPILSLEHKEDVMGLAFSPDGLRLVSSGMNPAECFVWDLSTGEKKVQLGENATFELLSAVGTNPKSPTEIAFGRGLNSRPQVNYMGRVSRAFDWAKLETIDIKSPYVYKGARELARGTAVPSIQFPMREELRTYLPLDNGHTVIGTNYGAYIDGNYMPISKDGLSINGLTMTPDKTRFVTGLENGLIRMYGAENGEQLAGLYVSENDDWVLWTPEGYYAASLEGARSVAWQTNMGAKTTPGYYPFEQFDLILNRPDLVLERLGGAEPAFIQALHKAYLKRLRKMDIKEEDLRASLDLPSLTVNYQSQEVTESVISIPLAASDKQGLRRIFVHVNDVPIFGQKGKSVLGEHFKDQIAIELTPGINKIQFTALNSRGVTSLTETRYVTFNAQDVKGDLFIVAIGVSDYQNDEFDLNYAAKDANDLVKLLESKSNNYDNITKIVLTDAQATCDKIKAVKDQLMQTSVNDQVILFVAGHGLLDEDYNYYFATHDVDFYNPSARGLIYEDLEGLLDGIPARKKLMLIDACHSGEVDEEDLEGFENLEGLETGVSSRGFAVTNKPGKKSMGLDKSIDLMSKYFNDLRKGTGAMIISSASGAEFAFESSLWQNGIFTYAVLEGLKSGNCDKDKDGQVQVSELRNYVFDKVTKLTGGMQHPTSRRENLENDFVVW